MRTASRLDFVAKSLALAGLGVLGFSAALLDRWTAALPTVPPPAMDVTAPAVQIAMMLPHPDSAFAVPAKAKLRRFPATRSPESIPESKHDTAGAEIALAPALDFVASPPDQLPVPVEAAPVTGSLVALSVLPPTVDTWQPMAVSAVAPAERSDEGFVSGVLKKTGSSVSNSLGKASTTLLGAARVVGDVVRRAF